MSCKEKLEVLNWDFSIISEEHCFFGFSFLLDEDNCIKTISIFLSNSLDKRVKAYLWYYFTLM